jgi:hypothetical protein
MPNSTLLPGARQGIGVYFFTNRKDMLYSAIRVPWEGKDGKDKHAGFGAGCGFS